MKKTNKQNGITLVALIITIIILLILAGISIASLTQTGLFGKAQEAKRETEIANIKEEIQLDIYEKQLANTGNLTDQDLKEILEKHGTINYEEDGVTIKGIITDEGYEIFLSDIYSGTTIKTKTLLADGSWNSTKGVNSPQLMEGMTGVYWDANGNEVTVTAENQDNWYDYNNQKWANATTKDGSYWVWIPRYAYQITSNLYNGGEGISGTINIKFLQGTTNNDSTGKEISTKYPTVADNKMQDFVVHPAYQDGSTKGKNNNYMNGEWKEEIPGFWVAKYAAGFQANTISSNEEIVVNASDTVVYSNKKYTSQYGELTTNALGQDLSSTNYLNQKLSYPVFKPLTCAYNVISTGDCFTISQEIAKAGSFYGLNLNKTDSHMMKNSEWGAVAYLTQSNCGRNGTEVTINSKNLDNSSKFIYAVTGYAEDTANGVSASSTNNMSGVFDLSGCVWERTAAYITNGNEILSKYGNSFIAKTEADANGYKTLSTEYVTVYPYDSVIDNDGNNYIVYKQLKSNTYGYGDAILETSLENNTGSGWNQDYSRFASFNSPFFMYGGNMDNGAGAGLFAFALSDGAHWSGNGFRAVLVGV